MSELIVEIAVYLCAAGLIGLLLGYVIWGLGQRSRIADARADGAASARTSVDGDAGIRTQLAECKKERQRLEREVERLSKQILETEGRLTASPEERTEEPIGATPIATSVAETEALDDLRDAIFDESPEDDHAPQPSPAPTSLLKERPDEVDDLKCIKGVGKVMEGVLNDKGIFLFQQVANFSGRDVDWVNGAIDAFPGRIQRDDWVGQAQMLYREKYGRAHVEGDE